MSVVYPGFAASDDEVQLASRLLEQNKWNRTSSLSFASATGIFSQNGLSPKQIRDIWKIVDINGSGTLSRDQLVVAIRLIGWAQAGEAINEELLSNMGPQPKLKGFTDKVPKTVDAPLTPISPQETSRFNIPAVDGFSRTDKATGIYTDSSQALGHVTKILELVESKERDGVELHNFSVGMELVQLLKSWLISVPPNVPLELWKALQSEISGRDASLRQLPQPHSSLHSSLRPILAEQKPPPPSPTRRSDISEDIKLPKNLESSLQTFIKDIENTRMIRGGVACEFASESKLSVVDLVRLWGETNIYGDSTPSPTRLNQFSQLVRGKLMETIRKKAFSSNIHSKLSSADPLVFPLRTPKRITQDPIPRAELPTNTAALPPQAKVVSRAPIRSNTTHESFLTELERETSQLPQPTERFILAQGMKPNKPRPVNDPLDENNRHKLPRSEKERKIFVPSFRSDQFKQVEGVEEVARLQTELLAMTQQRDSWEKTASALKSDVSEQRVQLEDLEGKLVVAKQNTDDLQKTVDIQSGQILELTELLNDKGQAVSDSASPPSDSTQKQELRVLFLRASLCESQAATAGALREAQSLQRTVATQSEQITELQKQLDMERPLQWEEFDLLPLDDDSTNSDSSDSMESSENGLEPFPFEPEADPTSMDKLRKAYEDLLQRNFGLRSAFRNFERNTRNSQERLAQETGHLTARLAASVEECTSLRQLEVEQREMLRRAQAETDRVQKNAMEEAEHLGAIIDSQTQVLWRMRMRMRAQPSKKEKQTNIQESTPLRG